MGCKITMSEAEAFALRDDAADLLLEAAAERLHFPEEEEHFLAAADVYGACRNVQLRFSRTKGISDSYEDSAEVDFTDRAMVWMRGYRDELRSSLEESRGGIEINDESAPRRTFLLWVLDGICRRAGDAA